MMFQRYIDLAFRLVLVLLHGVALGFVLWVGHTLFERPDTFKPVIPMTWVALMSIVAIVRELKRD